MPSTYTFWDLHCAIQDAFGWNNSHLHQFKFKDKATNTEMIFGIPTEDDFDLDIPTIPGWKHKISKYLNPLYPKIEYVYDFGDNWEHIIKLEDVIPAEKGVIYPRCIKGKRNSPPDDCGGAWGYLELLEVLNDPKHEEHESTKEWVESIKGGPFDPETFNPDAVTFIDPMKRFKECFR